MREWDPWIFSSVNRNKRSITLDLKSERGRETVYRMVKKVDVVVEGFRPGVMKKLGLDFETLKQFNPQLIYCAITGFGQNGPYRNIPGHDLNFLGIAGALSMSGNVDEDPPAGHVQKVPYSDLAAGVYAATAILASLHAQRREPVFIDISITDIVYSWALLKSSRLLQGKEPLREPHYGIFRTRDGKHVVLGIIEDHFWTAFCKKLGLTEWLDEAYATYADRLAKQQEILPKLKETIASWDRDALVKELLSVDVPCTPIHSIADTLNDPQLKERGVMTPIDSGLSEGQASHELAARYRMNVPIVGLPLVDNDAAPQLGEHTEEILKEFNIQWE